MLLIILKRFKHIKFKHHISIISYAIVLFISAFMKIYILLILYTIKYGLELSLVFADINIYLIWCFLWPEALVQSFCSTRNCVTNVIDVKIVGHYADTSHRVIKMDAFSVVNKLLIKLPRITRQRILASAEAIAFNVLKPTLCQRDTCLQAVQLNWPNSNATSHHNPTCSPSSTQEPTRAKKQGYATINLEKIAPINPM